jgi:hypothetical protein
MGNEGPTISSAPSGAAPRTACPQRPPGLQGQGTATDDNWVTWLGGKLDINIKGSKFSLTRGDVETNIRGWKHGIVMGNLNEAFLDAKTVAIGGSEVAMALAVLAEAFIGVKGVLNVGVCFLSEHGGKNKAGPSNKKTTPSFNEKDKERQEFLGDLKELCGDSTLRCQAGKKKVANLMRTYKNAKCAFQSLEEHIGAYDGEFGDVVWKADAWTEACSGKYKIEANEFDAEASGSSKVEGSKVVAVHKGGYGIKCGGGKVKIGTHLVIS